MSTNTSSLDLGTWVIDTMVRESNFEIRSVRGQTAQLHENEKKKAL